MNDENILNRVKTIIMQTVPDVEAEDINVDMTLTSLGIDSIVVVELGVRVEEEFGDKVELDDWLDIEYELEEGAFKLNSLIKFINEALS